MKNVNEQFIKQAGVSMVEMLVVFVVISIVAALALMQFGSSRQQFQRQNVAQQLKQSFERARFDSVKRRANTTAVQAKVIVESSRYTLVTDNNSNGVLTDAEDSIVSNFTDQTIIPGPGSSATLPVTVTFDQRGEVAVATPVFLVCNPTCTVSTRDNSNANIVLVTPTGTVNLLAGSADVPTFSAPSQTTVNSNSGIKNDVTIP